MGDVPTTEAPIPGVTEPDGPALAIFEPAELGSVVAIYVLMAIIIGFILYAVTYRKNYRPIKARQPYVTLFSAVVGTLWITGNNWTLRVFPVEQGFPVSLCIVMNIWVTTLGMFGFVSTYLFRMWRLFLAFTKRKQDQKLLWLPISVLAIITIALCALYTGLGLVGLYTVSTGEQVCYNSNEFFYPSMVYALLQVVIFVALALYIRKIPMRYFAEYKGALVSGGVALVIWIIYVVFTWFSFQYTLWGRVLLIWLVFIIVAFNAVHHLGVAIYYSFVDPVGFENSFNEQMRRVTSESSTGASHMTRGNSKVLHDDAKKSVHPDTKDGSDIETGSLNADVLLRELSATQL